MLLYILIIIGVILLLALLVEVIIPILCIVGIVALCIYVPVVIPFLIGIAVLGAIGAFLYYVVYPAILRVQDRHENRKWLKNNTGKYKYSSKETEKMLYTNAVNNFNTVENGYMGENIPWGRVNAFLSYFEKNIETDNVLFYFPIQSKKFDKLREYGYAVTNYGIYYCVEYEDSNTSKFIPFYHIKQCYVKDDELSMHFVGEDDQSFYKYIRNSTLANPLCDFLHSLISENYNTVDPETVIDRQDYNIIEMKNYSRSGVASAVLSSKLSIEQWNKEQKNYLNARQAGGYAAEYANNTIDRALGKNVENMAQQLDERGKQLKNGADRLVNGVEIQTKYYQSASATVNAAFDNGRPRYIRSDGSGKMMQIEVPREQYQGALEIMQGKIDRGEIPNIGVGEDATNYIRKGHVTYQQAQNIAAAGTVEGIVTDGMSGAVVAVPGASISALLTIAFTYWNSEDEKLAISSGLKVGTEVLGRTVAAQIIAGQLNRESLAVPLIKNATIHNPLSNVGKGIEAATAGKFEAKMVNGTIAMATVAFGPDVIRNLQGKISTDQLLKNSAVTASGIAAGLFCPVGGPIASIVASMATSFVVKNILDDYIEDDVQKMFRVLKLQFLDNVMALGLSDEEIKEVANETIAHPDIENILKNMYMTGRAEEYARDLVQGAVLNVLEERNIISGEMVDSALIELADIIKKNRSFDEA